ncbi:leucine-rich repeat receptor-like protein kinase PXL1 [Tanacetum coccineum]
MKMCSLIEGLWTAHQQHGSYKEDGDRSGRDLETNDSSLHCFTLQGRQLLLCDLPSMPSVPRNSRNLTMHLKKELDHNSFGVVLLEMLSVDIVKWVRNQMNKRDLEHTFDLGIGGECKFVRQEIAHSCTDKLPKERPLMRDVIIMLGEAKLTRKSVCDDISTKEKPIFNNSPVIGLL